MPTSSEFSGPFSSLLNKVLFGTNNVNNTPTAIKMAHFLAEPYNPALERSEQP